MAELRLRYHQQLEVIDAKVVQLFALVADGLVAATDAILNGDRDTHAVLHQREGLVDQLYLDIETLVNEQLALQAPVAGDLRFLLSVLRIVPELERSHDLVEHIAQRAEQGVGEELTPRARGLIGRMGALGARMWQEEADAWYERSAGAALAVAALDLEMNDLHAELTLELNSGRMALAVAVDLALVARFYERLGDHAVNVGRRTAYLAGEPRGLDGPEPVA